MNSPAAILALLQTSDSAFPSGAFAFSNGLEGLIRDSMTPGGAAGVEETLLTQILPRWSEFDRVFLAQAHAAAGDLGRLAVIDMDCESRALSRPLRDASLSIGRALLTTHSRMGTPGAAAFRAEVRNGTLLGHAAVVQGWIGWAIGLDLPQTEAGSLFGQLAAFTSAAVRLGHIGALDAQGILMRCNPAAAVCLGAPAPDQASGFAPLIEIAATRRCVGDARLFAN